MRAHPLAVDIVLTIGLGVVAMLIHFRQGTGYEGREFRDPTWWTVALSLAVCLPILWRRSHAVVVAPAVVILQANCELFAINSTGWFPVLVAMYSLGAHAAGRSRAVSSALVFMITVLLVASGLAANEIDGAVAFGTLTALVVPLVIGDNIRRRRNEVAELSERADRAERERELLASRRVDEERARIARELHDIVAHSVSVMVIQASAAGRNLRRDLDAAQTLLTNIEDTGRETMGELRQILGVLRDSSGDAPLQTEPLVPDFDGLVGSLPELDVRMQRTGSIDNVPIGVAMAAYRVVQEALTNVHRHAGPGVTVDVDIACTGADIDVTVIDDGRGASTRAGSGGGYGLVGMRERVAAFGGTLTTGPRRAGGWQVRATFPLAADRRADAGRSELSSPVPAVGPT